jgi:hypothetical protein
VENIPLPDVIWDWAKTTGPAGFALIVWWLERKERIEAQKRNEALTDRLAKISENATLAVNRLTDILTAGREHK